MPAVQAWKCPETGKLFEDKAVYRTHLRNIVLERWREKTFTRFLFMSTEALRRESSFEDIAAWLMTHGDFLVTLNKLVEDRAGHSLLRKSLQYFRFTSVKFRRMVWDDALRAPYGKAPLGQSPRDGETYRGWRGRLDIKYIGETPSHPTHIFDYTGIHTGSGSGVPKQYSSEVVLFGDDWPVLAVMERLSVPALVDA